MPPAIIFGSAALCFSETATFKMKRAQAEPLGYIA